jgi:hypothetical protein
MASDTRNSSQSPQAKRGSSQDHEQHEGRGEVPESWYPEPTLEKSDVEIDAAKANNSDDAGLYAPPARKA